jgi:2,3-bisphosphoglycerate-independent phosphoglycerate mutase
MKNKFPTMLVILDGFGYRESQDHNAIAHAHMPHFFNMLANYPWTTLNASGPAVGLPQGYIGNSEVGHLTMGCGTIIKQPMTLIEEAFEQKKPSEIPTLKSALMRLAKQHKVLHIMGLLSDAGVHSSTHHVYKFLQAAKDLHVPVVIHPFLDGRDTNPGTALTYLHELDTMVKKLGVGTIGSIHGRFYAMDRNNNWHLTEKSYHVLTEQQSHTAKSWQEVLDKAQQEQMSEEFIPPIQLAGSHYIKPGDGVLFFNFRPDRARQLTKLFLNGNGKDIKSFPLSTFITPVSYGSQYDTTVLFHGGKITQTLTGMLNDHDYSICSIAETEKYAHVTYFFNGGREEKLPHETRILIPSITRKSYDTHPAMSADTVTEAAFYSLRYNPHDFYVINYANADMVGHTGNFQATVHALECIDKQLGLLFDEVVTKQNGILIITGDHGKAEEMFDTTTQQARTSHTTNPVYFVVVQQELEHQHAELPLTQLSDIAPFIAHLVMKD